MNIASALPRAPERYPELIARLWAAGTNSADMARILDLPEAEVERIRLRTTGPRVGARATSSHGNAPGA